ncbi:MAG TPA: hypothetical protein VFM02_04595 [Candidatus Paceibacterota bacterium]|nr:hypothetical protein [Candidatus Paceibacterota bacterium]
MKKLISIVVVIVVLVVAGIAVWFYATPKETINENASSTAASSTSTSTAGEVGTSSQEAENASGTEAEDLATNPIPSGWQSYSANIWKISYPSTWQVTPGAPQGRSSTFWSELSQEVGGTNLTLLSPKGFMQGTNLQEVRLTVGSTNTPSAVQSCTALPSNRTPETTATPVTINGIPFTKITTSDAGAGNFYNTVSYRTVRNGSCYAVEYTIHSTNIGNYPPEQGIKEFDETAVTAILQEIIGTFHFSI